MSNTNPNPVGTAVSGTILNLGQFGAGYAQGPAVASASQASLFGMSGWADAPVNEQGTIPAVRGSVQTRYRRYGYEKTPAKPGIVQTPAIQLSQRVLFMPPAQLKQYQEKMLAAGMYRSSVQAKDIAFGTRDQYTLEAWQNTVLTAAQYTAAGSKLTFDQVLNSFAESGAGLVAASGGGGGGGGAAAYQPTQLTDPASLRQMADQISGKLIGRRLTDKEKEALVSRIHGDETKYSADVRGQAATLTNPDPQARMIENIQQDFQPEYQATNVANTYDMFSQIIGGSSR